jgi:ceramide glucosyltransferase
MDADLENNLASFFEQDHPRYELIFGVEDPGDPALQVVDRLRARFPSVACRVIVSGIESKTRAAANAKVRNLQAMLPNADFDLVLTSDSNVRVPRHYVREMAAVFAGDPRAGMVTSIFAGIGEDTFGAALESVQLNGFCAAGATLPTMFGDAAVVGKSMLFSRARFEKLGGFAPVLHLLAEDFLMGKMFQHAGLKVLIGPTVVCNVTRGLSLRAFWARHLRWAMIRWRLRPFGALAEPLVNPLALLPLALLALGTTGAMIWLIALWFVRDVLGWIVLRGPRRAWLGVLAPIRDLSALALWLLASWKRHIRWRGNRVRVGTGTMLFTDSESSSAPLVPKVHACVRRPSGNR